MHQGLAAPGTATDPLVAALIGICRYSFEERAEARADSCLVEIETGTKQLQHHRHLGENRDDARVLRIGAGKSAHRFPRAERPACTTRSWIRMITCRDSKWPSPSGHFKLQWFRKVR